MEKALKRLLRVYPVARNWMALSNYTAPLQSVQNASQMYSTNLSDYSQMEDITKLSARRNAFNTTRIIQEPEKILEAAATDYINMTLHDAVNMLTMLFRASRRTKSMCHIESHMGFVRLCEVLNRGMRTMKLQDVIECLKVLTYFQTCSNSFLMQSLLQMIRTNVNEMSLHDIIFTTFLLNKIETTPLRDALLIALPLVFEVQLPTKLDTDDVTLLIWSLRFVSEHNVQNQDVLEIILKSLYNHEDTLDTQMARSIFYSLCHLSDLSPTAHKLLFNVQDILASSAKEINVGDITKILEKLSSAAVSREQPSIFYNETHVDTLVNSALSSDVDFAKGIFILKSLNDLNHMHMPLLEYLAGKCFENSSLLKGASYNKISTFLEGFINADYKPVFWDTIKDAILENIETDKRFFNRSFIRFALHLIALDCYSTNLLRKVFSINVRLNEPMKNVYAREMLLLYQSVKALYPTYDGPWPQQDLLEYANTIKLTPPAHSLKPALERALGGPQYAHHNLKTRLGHHIDHVIVMRKGGYPIAINTETNISSISKIAYVEDIQTPSESQMIFIFNLPDSAYAVNSQRLKSTWALKIKSAETLTNSNTIGINSNSWMKLPEYERVPYLMQAIKLKCEVSMN
ncbi:PREDICTED: uncharacterized protein LOC106750330 [Dinoponera quadriceps]|uniref:Uncharacterized protein LOC106750330 n=1 Tax=Dinoponera quadriceps TaxID=609295 RepID=A0A6P3Y7U0_DINQU|nr:PREDICTED: uncharacterized protein LOC106750330 [Dinoponera quadriceps]XP_014486090.1 PREDICTED: uncharacterized protein LOC106750330 [Dinoponera quadriceps]XP_014486091.1 PREDICTED: uncharacterized protein LOC106750330 [Dinoponera quadriceps]XP_014486092.1 PREDICTED: uncharacterized protein LOC106750330 [Dinoponera quadriceps]